ncbi:hypothetical protein XELAEV_18037837mg [Xenopus laevis]|uniref:Uncharacterized protein n=1 Tax=Xenopus laevis TaxID=8355 RepID=A0A974CD11_XENLA|nr:hypothetical protein XELAEV_18037837mg [Xenopus laevis]
MLKGKSCNLQPTTILNCTASYHAPLAANAMFPQSFLYAECNEQFMADTKTMCYLRPFPFYEHNGNIQLLMYIATRCHYCIVIL